MTAPDNLSAARAALFAAITADYMLEPHELELLAAACGALDRADEARAALDTDGLWLDGRYGPRLSPLVAVERDSRLVAARLFRQLGLGEHATSAHRAPDRKARR